MKDRSHGSAPAVLRLASTVALWTLLAGCGDPNVPLTRPPEDAFRVSSPRPRRIDRPASRPRPTPSRPGLSIARVTADFLGIPWQVRSTPVSLLRTTAEFLEIPLPTPLPTGPRSSPSASASPSPGSSPPVSLPLDLDALDLESLDPEQLETLEQQLQEEVTGDPQIDPIQPLLQQPTQGQPPPTSP